MLTVTGSLTSLQTMHFKDMDTFYRELLGEPIAQKPGEWSQFSLQNTRLVVWQAKEDPARGDALQLCLTVSDLDEARSNAPEKLVFSEIQLASHGRECFFKDPDGNTLILYEPKMP